MGDELDLERRLRELVAGRRPAAPPSIREYILAVPSSPVAPESRARRRRMPGRLSPMTWAGLAAAAVIVAAVAGSAALISIKPNPSTTAKPAASGSAPAPSGFDFVTNGWGWRLVGEPSPGPIAAVANGYLGECVAAGVPAPCTSRDAVIWAVPPDPAVFAVAGTGAFGGWSVAHGAAGWVATGTVNAGTWRSVDGTHWTAVAIDLPGLQSAQVQAIAGGFAMIAQVYDGKRSNQQVLTSVDGSTWTQRSLPAGTVSVSDGGAIGLVTHATQYRLVALSFDPASTAGAATQTPLTLPYGASDLASTVRLPGGTWVGLVNSSGLTVVTSSDGATWKAAAGPGPGISSLILVGDRLLAVSMIANTSVAALWESTDAKSWRLIQTLDGYPSATSLTSLGDRVALYSGSKLVRIGVATTESSTPTNTPRPGPTPSAGSSGPVPGENVDIGGWRWTAMGTTMPDPFSARVIRLPGGYLGFCGTAMCTSPNGWSWQSPPDPAIFSADSTAVFRPEQVVHRDGIGYVILAGEGVWFSADGVHWQPSNAPTQSPGYQGVLATAAGFALIGPPNDPVASRSSLFVSSDGLTWKNSGLLEALFISFGSSPDTSGGLIAMRGKNTTQRLYSANGSTWKLMNGPTGTLFTDQPLRLADGTLVISDSSGLLRSSDGKVWTRVKTWTPTSVAVVGNRILLVGSEDAAWLGLWESSDSGASFHKVMAPVAAVQPWGDLVMVRTSSGGYWVGASLSPQETPGPSAATVLPTSPATPAPRAETPPPGGISEAEALRIAAAAAHPDATEVASASPGVEAPGGGTRWVWNVRYSSYSGGVLNAQGRTVEIDYFTGEVLLIGYWIS